MPVQHIPVDDDLDIILSTGSFCEIKIVRGTTVIMCFGRPEETLQWVETLSCSLEVVAREIREEIEAQKQEKTEWLNESSK